MKTLNLTIKYRWTGSWSSNTKNFYEFHQVALIHKSGALDSAVCYDITNHKDETYIDFKSLDTETKLDFVKDSIAARSKDYKYFKITFADKTTIIVQTIEELGTYMNSLQ